MPFFCCFCLSDVSMSNVVNATFCDDDFWNQSRLTSDLVVCFCQAWFFFPSLNWCNWNVIQAKTLLRETARRSPDQKVLVIHVPLYLIGRKRHNIMSDDHRDAAHFLFSEPICSFPSSGVIWTLFEPVRRELRAAACLNCKCFLSSVVLLLRTGGRSLYIGGLVCVVWGWLWYE